MFSFFVLCGFAFGFVSGVLWLAVTITEKLKTHDCTYDGVAKWKERPSSKSSIENNLENDRSGNYHYLVMCVGLIALNAPFGIFVVTPRFMAFYEFAYVASSLVNLILYLVIGFNIFKFAIKANRHWLIFGTSFVLFLVSFFSGLFLLKFVEMPFEIESLYLVLWDSVASNFVFSLLLAFCPISAGAILWAYSQNRLPYRPRVVFSLGLLVSMISIIIGILLSIRMRNTNSMAGCLTGVPSTIDIVHYFPSSLGAILLISGLIIVILLQKPDWKKAVKLIFTR
jgi:hypothetical protein